MESPPPPTFLDIPGEVRVAHILPHLAVPDLVAYLRALRVPLRRLAKALNKIKAYESVFAMRSWNCCTRSDSLFASILVLTKTFGHYDGVLAGRCKNANGEEFTLRYDEYGGGPHSENKNTVDGFSTILAYMVPPKELRARPIYREWISNEIVTLDGEAPDGWYHHATWPYLSHDGDKDDHVFFRFRNMVCYYFRGSEYDIVATSTTRSFRLWRESAEEATAATAAVHAWIFKDHRKGPCPLREPDYECSYDSIVDRKRDRPYRLSTRLTD